MSGVLRFNRYNERDPNGAWVYFTDHEAAVAAAVEQARADVLRDAPASVFVKAFSDGRASGYDVGRAEALREAAEAVEALGETHPKWNVTSTHYDGCWKSHSECALTYAIDVILALLPEQERP